MNAHEPCASYYLLHILGDHHPGAVGVDYIALRV